MGDDDGLLLLRCDTDRPQGGALPLPLHQSQHEDIQHAQARGDHHHVAGERERLQERLMPLVATAASSIMRGRKVPATR